MTDTVIAEVVLRAADGSSILDASDGITADDIERYRAEDEVAHEAARALKALGFKVEQTGPVGLTISGDKERFEEVFQTSLRTRTTPIMPAAESAERTYYEAVNPIRLPAELAGLIAGVTLPIPPEYFP